MEHLNFPIVIRYIGMFRLSLIFLFAVILAGCEEKPTNPEPELLDPIYLDLLKQRGDIEAYRPAAEKTLEITKQDMIEAVPHTGIYKRKRMQYFKEWRSIRKMRQDSKYLEMLALRRQIEARRSYRRAIKNGDPWPNPAESRKYKAIRKLKTASKNWDSRLPSLDDRIEKYSAKFSDDDKKK